MKMRSAQKTGLIKRGEKIFTTLMSAMELMRRLGGARLYLPGIGTLIRRPQAVPAPAGSFLMASLRAQGEPCNVYLHVEEKEIVPALLCYRASFEERAVAPPKGSRFIDRMAAELQKSQEKKAAKALNGTAEGRYGGGDTHQVAGGLPSKRGRRRGQPPEAEQRREGAAGDTHQNWRKQK